MKSSIKRLKKCFDCVTRSSRQPISVSSSPSAAPPFTSRKACRSVSISLPERLEAHADRNLAELETTRDLSQCIVHVDMDAFFASVEVHPATLLDSSSSPSRESTLFFPNNAFDQLFATLPPTRRSWTILRSLGKPLACRVEFFPRRRTRLASLAFVPAWPST
jgi:hypothetical protein